jgi:hypothetical protein
MIDLDIITYINDILIYSQIQYKYEKLMKVVLSHLKTSIVEVSIDEYRFYKSNIEFIGYMISDMGITIAEDKV